MGESVGKAVEGLAVGCNTVVGSKDGSGVGLRDVG